MHWIKGEPVALGPPLSTGVSFVRIDPDWKLPQDNQRVSSSVCQRLPIIIVVGYIYIYKPGLKIQHFENNQKQKIPSKFMRNKSKFGPKYQLLLKIHGSYGPSPRTQLFLNQSGRDLVCQCTFGSCCLIPNLIWIG